MQPVPRAMRPERHFLALYWEDRRDPLASCIERTRELVGAMGRVDAALARWFPLAKTKEESLAAPLDGADALARAYTARRTEAPAHDPHGFSLTAWNGMDGADSMKLELTMGAHLELPNCPAPNSAVLWLPRGEGTEVAARLLTSRALEALVSAMARVIDPDWGVVGTDKWLTSDAMTREHEVGAPRVAWLTYLRSGRGAVPELPAPARTTAVRAGETHVGNLITLHDAIFGSDDLDALDGAEALRERLAAAGLLAPTARRDRG